MQNRFCAVCSLNTPTCTHVRCLCASSAKNVDQLLQLPFSDSEEAQLLAYLSTNQDSVSQELLVMYYLQRSRFIEAIRLNKRLRQSGGLTSEAQQLTSTRALTRNSIVDGYERVLPRVQRKLAFAPELNIQRRSQARKECELYPYHVVMPLLM